MADRKQILLDVPCEVVAWIAKQADEHVRSIRGEATWMLVEAFRKDGGRIGEPSPVQDELEDQDPSARGGADEK